MSEDKERETQEYLARIRRTIAESSRLVMEANLRIAETDRMLEKQGLTREQVMGFEFTDEQREAVNCELVRQGMEPMELGTGNRELGTGNWELGNGELGIGEEELAERQRKFGMMMKPFQI